MAQALRLKREKPREYLTLEGEPPLGQRLHLWPGVPLIACVQATKDGIHNSMLLAVQGYTGDTITLKVHTPSPSRSLRVTVSPV